MIWDAMAVQTVTPATNSSVVVMNAHQVLFLEAAAVASEEVVAVSVDFFFLC